MSYRTFNVIVKIENDEKEIKEYLINNFKFFNIKQFFEPFDGLVCQANENWKKYPFEKFPDNFFKNQDDVNDYFGEQIDEKILQFSEHFPDKEIAFVYVDCFGGRCSSEGYVVKNVEKITEQEPHHSGHQTILKQIYPNYNSWFFYPFTRTYFSDKGGINGDVINFSFLPICMAVNQEFGNNKNYSLQISENEMFLACPNSFDIYFMKISDGWIKVTGRIITEEVGIFEKVKDIIEDIFLGMEYNIQIDNFENGESIILSTIDNTKHTKIKSISHRATAFNTRPLDLNPSEPRKSNAFTEPDNKKKSFWDKLFGK